MSVEILEGGNGGAVFYCNTTDWAFGPLMPDGEVAEAFLKTFQRPNDPRVYTDVQLEKAWIEFRKKLSCPFGHFEKAAVENCSAGTIFTCTEEGCKAIWDVDGNVIADEDEDEDDDLTEAERLGVSMYGY